MASWKEKMDAEIRQNVLNAQQSQARQAKEAQHEKRKSDEEARMFGLLDRLKIKEKLESIRQEVWEDGEVRYFEDYGDHKEQNRIIGYNNGQMTRKGYALRYQYQKSVRRSEPIYEEKIWFL